VALVNSISHTRYGLHRGTVYDGTVNIMHQQLSCLLVTFTTAACEFNQSSDHHGLISCTSGRGTDDDVCTVVRVCVHV